MIADLLKNCKNKYLSEDIEKELLKAHPKQVIIEDTRFILYKVKYQYTTVRHNRKEGIKYFVLRSSNPSMNIEKVLLDWIESFNIENKHRQLSNVKFLESQCLGYIVI